MPETNEGVLLLFGAVFFLIGLLGGGFEIAAIKVPRVGTWPRLLSAVMGLVFIGLALSQLFISPSLPQPAAVVDTPTPAPTSVARAPTNTPVPATPAPATATPVPPTRTAVAEAPSPTAKVAAEASQETGAGGWQKLADLPRHINSFVVDLTNSQVLYAATGDQTGSGGGVYRSEDAGRTWQRAASGLPSERVTALAFGHGERATLYATVGTRGDLYASADGAASWSLRGDTGFFGGYDRLLRVDPRNPDLLYFLARSNALMRSRDAGYTWQSIGEGLPSDERATFALSLAIDPTDSDVLYVGTGGFVGGGQGVYKSTDGGDTWSASNRGMLDYRITAVAVDPLGAQTVYAGSDAGELFKSTDGGQTWQEMTDDLPAQTGSHPTIQQIVAHPSAPDTVYLLMNATGVVVTADGGDTWRLLGQPGQISYTTYTALTVLFDAEPVFLVGIEREGGWRYGG
jgi:photosystem II stability/assembly factor-like uncharacterized protein